MQHYLRNYGIDFLTELGKYLKPINYSVKYIQMFEFNCDLLNTVSCYIKNMKLIFKLSIIFLSLKASATTLPQLSLDDLYDSAEFVGIILIEEGKLIRKEDQICASQYTANILESFKGQYRAGEQITFGPFSGKGIGQKYLLFLTKKEKQFKPMNSTNSMSMKRENDYQKICGSVLPDLLISFHGYGILKIGTPHQFKYKESIRIPDRYISIPKQLNKKAVEFGDDRILGDPFWVEEKEFIMYMRKHYE